MVTDILLHDYDLKLDNGDFAIGQSDYQHVYLLLSSYQGHWRQWPILGIGINNYLNGVIDKTIERNIRVSLEYDGAKKTKIKLINKGIEIIVNYE